MEWIGKRHEPRHCTRRGGVAQDSGRGRGLSIQDNRHMETDFGLVVTSPWSTGAKVDVNSQTVISGPTESTGGYDPLRGGEFPWHEQSKRDYLLGLDKEVPHSVTDSAASATSLVSGVKTYNGAINVRSDGTQLIPIARDLAGRARIQGGNRNQCSGQPRHSGRAPTRTM